jgi:hypothetical protein
VVLQVRLTIRLAVKLRPLSCPECGWLDFDPSRHGRFACFTVKT